MAFAFYTVTSFGATPRTSTIGKSNMKSMRDAKSNHRDKPSTPPRQRRGRLPLGGLNLPAFDYYRPLRRFKQGLDKDSIHALSLDEAARAACLEPKYFSSLFHKKVGISFVTWRNSLRINKAIEEIREADYPMGDVADAAGFNNLRTFERAFKRHTGITAAQFKKSVASTRSSYRKAKNTKNAAKSR